MKTIWVVQKSRKSVAVIPSMDVNSERVKSLANEFDKNEVDSIVVEDRLPEFRFSKSMNAGIQEALKYPDISTIVLSNDDVNNIKGLNEMINTVVTNKTMMTRDIYAVPYVDGSPKIFYVTTSRLGFMWSHTLMNKAPFHAKRVLSGFGWTKNRKKFAMGAPAVKWQSDKIYSIQPFSVLSSSVLKRFMFDENFINGLEDDELGYRLWKNNIKGVTNPAWSIHHSSNVSFKEVRQGKKSNIGLCYSSDEEMVKSAEYFYDKHFRGKKLWG